MFGGNLVKYFAGVVDFFNKISFQTSTLRNLELLLYSYYL